VFLQLIEVSKVEDVTVNNRSHASCSGVNSFIDIGDGAYDYSNSAVSDVIDLQS